MLLNDILNLVNIQMMDITSWKDLKMFLLKDSIQYDIQFDKSPLAYEKQVSKQTSIFGDSYVYERSMRYPKVEEDYRNKWYSNCEKGYKNKFLLFNSGMSAISVLMDSFFGGYRNRRLTVLKSSGYFEANQYFRKLDYRIRTIMCTKSSEFINNIQSNNIAVLYIEPVDYSLQMGIFDLLTIIKEFTNKKSDFIRMIVIDCTLMSHFNIPIAEIEAILKEKNIILAVVESLMKLFQFGMELVNLGGIYLSFPTSNHFMNSFDNFILEIEDNRDLYGCGLRLNQLRLLSHPFMSKAMLQKDYIHQVLKNNKIVAKRIINPIFSYVLHPSLLMDDCTFEWTESPFIIIRLADDMESSYDKVVRNLLDKCSKDQIDFGYGSSFGFWSSRFEKIIYDKQKNSCFLKVAIGYDDSQLEQIISVLNKIE